MHFNIVIALYNERLDFHRFLYIPELGHYLVHETVNETSMKELFKGLVWEPNN